MMACDGGIIARNVNKYYKSRPDRDLGEMVAEWTLGGLSSNGDLRFRVQLLMASFVGQAAVFVGRDAGLAQPEPAPT
jgi:hypothetical protein